MAPPSVLVLLISALFACTYHQVLALPDFPLQTSASDNVFHAQGWSPRPTDNPSNHPSNIFARQNLPDFPGDAQKVLVAPDNTCGYLSGLQGAPFSCSSAYKCVFFSATGSYYGPIACCTSGKNCRIRTACVASTDYFSKSACDAGCKLDLYTLKCTNSASPYCGQVRFTNPNIQDYWCVTSSIETFYSGVTTYSNQPQRVFTTLDKSDLWPVSTSPSSTASTASSSSSPPTVDDGTKPPSVDSGKSTNVGAIVGGVIGGVAFVAIIGFAAYLLMRRRKLKNRPSELGTGGFSQGFSQNIDMSYGGRAEVEGNANQVYKTDPSHGYGHQQPYDPPRPQELYAEPSPTHQELYAPATGTADATGRYVQVPTEDGRGYYYQGGSPRT